MTQTSEDPNLLRRFRYSVLAAQKFGNNFLTEQLKPYNIAPAGGEALTIIAQKGPLTIRDLGKLMLTESDHPSRLVQRLENLGFVTKQPHPSDGRSTSISLTPAGEDVAKLVLTIEARWDAYIQSMLWQDDIQRITSCLIDLVRDTESGAAIQERFGLGD